MKKILGILALSAVAVTSACSDSDKKTVETNTTPNVETRAAGDLKIAYYIQDSITTGFGFYKLQDSLIANKQIAFQKELGRRSTELQNYIARNSEKAQNGLLTQNEIAQIQQAAQQKEGAIMQFQQQEGGKLEQESFEMMSVITKRISNFSKDFCLENGIDILLVQIPGGQVGFVGESMNVTDEFIGYLNQKQSELEADLTK